MSGSPGGRCGPAERRMLLLRDDGGYSVDSGAAPLPPPRSAALPRFRRVLVVAAALSTAAGATAVLLLRSGRGRNTADVLASVSRAEQVAVMAPAAVASEGEAPELVPERPHTFDSVEQVASAIDQHDESQEGVATDGARPLTVREFERGMILDEVGSVFAAEMDEVEKARMAWNSTLDRGGDGALVPKYRPVKPGRAMAFELYTFGAPGTTEHGVYNPAAPGGCFPGVRVATRARFFEEGTTMFRVRHDPVPSLLDFAYKHALMDYLSARNDDDANNNITECMYFLSHQPRLKDTPKWDNLWWLNGHMIYPSVLRSHADAPHTGPIKADDAPDDLKLISPPERPPKERRLLQQPSSFFKRLYYELTAQEKVEKAALMAHLCFLVYRKPQQIAMDAPRLGWTFVGMANAATDEGAASGLLGQTMGDVLRTSKAGDLVETVNSYTDGFGDHLLLLQHKATGQCVLSFEGSSMTDVKDWLSNLNFFSKEFCGFGKTHRGFRAKLYRMLGGIDYRQTIRRKLKYCSTITVTGHSLGGAEAELFAACTNNNLKRGEPGYLDSRLFSMPRGKPEPLLSWYSDKSVGHFIKNRANKWCIDVEGTAQTTYRAHVDFYPCETPDTFAEDQKWNFQDDGSIRSRLNGFCIDGNVTNGTAVQTWPCQHNLTDSHQKWELTKEGFLKNLKSGKCIDGAMRMAECPYSDQKWKLSQAGKMEHLLSGKCLSAIHAYGGAGKDATLIIMPCSEAEDASQLWEKTAAGELRNPSSDLCAAAHFETDFEDSPRLKLASCGGKQWNSILWHFGEDGTVHSGDTERCIGVEGQPGIADGSAIIVTACTSHLQATGLWSLDQHGFVVNMGYNKHDMYKCMDLYAPPFSGVSNKDPGTPLFLDFCKVNTDQKWEITRRGFIRSTIGGQKCLSIMNKQHIVDPLSPRLWIDNCRDPDDPAMFPSMKWKKKNGTTLVNVFSDKCLGWTETAGGLDKVESLEIAIGGQVVPPLDCLLAGANIEWEFRTDGEIVSKKSGECLTFKDSPGERNLVLLLSTCVSGEASQRWELMQNGLLRNKLNGLCAGNFLDSAAPEQVLAALSECPSGGPQLWEMLPTGQIKSKHTGQCLDAPQEEQPGLKPYQITLNACDPHRLQQKWNKIQAPRLILEV